MAFDGNLNLKKRSIAKWENNLTHIKKRSESSKITVLSVA